jgi:hypothetical protein
MHGIPAEGPKAYQGAAHLDCLPFYRSTKPPKTPPANKCDCLELLAEIKLVNKALVIYLSNPHH